MAAQILSFPSRIPVAKPLVISQVNGPVYTLAGGQTAATAKVLPMLPPAAASTLEQAAGNAVLKELERGYLEVEVSGVTLRQVGAIYSLLVRGAWAYALDSVRSALHPIATA